MLGRASRRAMCASGGGAAFIHVQNKKLSPIQKVRVGRQSSKSPASTTEVVYNVRVGGTARTCDVECAAYGAVVLGALAVEHGI